MSQKYSCVAIFNQNSRVYIECESLESNGYEDDDESATVYFENAASITILAKKIYNSKRKAISFANEVSDINIKVGTIEGGYYDEDFTGGDTITIRGSGYLTANEVISNSNGSCLAHKAGNFTANILKLTTTLNRSDSPNATVELSGGTGDQILTLQCDEIKATHAVCVKQEEGFLNLKARSIYSVYALSMDLSANADIEAVDIVSDSKGINIHNSSSQKIIIDANSIIGSNGNDGVVRSSSGSNYVLRNAKIKNTFTTGDSVCIYIESGNTNGQNIEIENIILVTGNSLSGKPIYRPGTNTININNYGLFVNRVIDRTLIILKIGTGTEGNYKFIQSSDIT